MENNTAPGHQAVDRQQAIGLRAVIFLLKMNWQITEIPKKFKPTTFDWPSILWVEGYIRLRDGTKSPLCLSQLSLKFR
jgi:hypothetical protein